MEIINETSVSTHAFAFSVMMVDIDAAVSLFRRRWGVRLPERFAFISKVKLVGSRSVLGGTVGPNGSIVVCNHFSMGFYDFKEVHSTMRIRLADQSPMILYLFSKHIWHSCGQMML